jgi:hypothetical protein
MEVIGTEWNVKELMLSVYRKRGVGTDVEEQPPPTAPAAGAENLGGVCQRTRCLKLHLQR